MTDESELIVSLERLEAASRRARPWLILGLLAIVTGFVVLVVVIDQLRRQEAERADMWQRKAHILEIRVLAMRESNRQSHTPGPGDQLEQLWQATQNLVAAAGRPEPVEAWDAASIAASNPSLSIETMGDLLARGFPIDGQIDGEQNRMIHLAAERCADRVVAWLLSRGANPNIANHWHDTPQHIADVRCGPNSATALALHPH